MAMHTAAAAAATAVAGGNVNDWLVLASQKAHIFYPRGPVLGPRCCCCWPPVQQSCALQHQAELQVLVF